MFGHYLLCAVPTDLEISHNSTAYYVLFRSDLPLGSIILNYTVYINVTAIGDPFGIFVSIGFSSLIIQSIFGFDNYLRSKDYFFPNTPSTYTVAGDIAAFEESIILRSPVSEYLFMGNIAVINIELTAVVVGSLTMSSYSYAEHDVLMFAIVTRPPGK